MKTFRGNWMQILSDARRANGGAGSLKIQNVNPKPSAGSRNIFEDDEKEIRRAAKAHGFYLASEFPAKIVSFIEH